jgi:hypothetical protein
MIPGSLRPSTTIRLQSANPGGGAVHTDEPVGFDL